MIMVILKKSKGHSELMNDELDNYRRGFIAALNPYLDMLRLRKETMSHPDWLELVNRTRQSIRANPDQYLGKALPSKIVVDKLVNEIFTSKLFFEE